MCAPPKKERRGRLRAYTPSATRTEIDRQFLPRPREKWGVDGHKTLLPLSGTFRHRRDLHSTRAFLFDETAAHDQLNFLNPGPCGGAAVGAYLTPMWFLRITHITRFTRTCVRAVHTHDASKRGLVCKQRFGVNE